MCYKNKIKQIEQGMKQAYNSKNFPKNISFSIMEDISVSIRSNGDTKQVSTSAMSTAQQFNLKQKHRTDKKSIGSSKSLARVLHNVYFRRLKQNFNLIRQFASVSESDSSVPVNQIDYDTPEYWLLNYQFQRNYTEESIESLRAAITRYIQKQKVFAFLRIKMLFKRKSRERYVQLNIGNFVYSIENAFSHFRKKTVEIFFQKVKKYSEEARFHKIHQKSSEFLRKTSKSVTLFSTAQKQTSKQIIYVVNTGRSSKNKSTDIKKKKIAYIKVPLMAQSVEVNEINLEGQFQTDKTHKKGSFFSSSNKQTYRAVHYNSRISKIGEHQNDCKNCKFCRQQQSLQIIERTSASKRKLSFREEFNFNRTKKMVRI